MCSAEDSPIHRPNVCRRNEPVMGPFLNRFRAECGRWVKVGFSPAATKKHLLLRLRSSEGRHPRSIVGSTWAECFTCYVRLVCGWLVCCSPGPDTIMLSLWSVVCLLPFLIRVCLAFNRSSPLCQTNSQQVMRKLRHPAVQLNIRIANNSTLDSDFPLTRFKGVGKYAQWYFNFSI